jgi:hypothetical protein
LLNMSHKSLKLPSYKFIWLSKVHVPIITKTQERCLYCSTSSC